jgi:hypothetical protein
LRRHGVFAAVRLSTDVVVIRQNAALSRICDVVAAAVLFGQREGRNGVAELRAQSVVAAGRDDNELSTACDIGHRVAWPPAGKGA